MDNLARLILVFLLAIASPAFAAVSYTVSWAGFTGTSSTVNGAATLVANQYTAAKYPICVSSSGQTLSTDSARVFSVSGLTVVFERYVIPTDSCNTPLRQSTVIASQSGTGDPENCASRAGKPWPAPSSGGAWNSGTRKAYTFCPDTGGTTTCVASGSAIYTASNGNNYIAGPWTYTGGVCAQAGLGTGSETQAPLPCPTGRCPGTLNGQSVCVACASITEQKSTQVSSSASSAASGATTSTTTSSGSSSSSSTTCTGNQCTTTTTTASTNPDGSTGQTQTSKTESKADYCTANPKASACADSGGSWSGGCGAFVCDGDAVQCAQARGAWELACSLKVEQTDTAVQVGTAAMARTEEASIKQQLAGVSTAFDIASRLDSTALFGTPGACPADVTVSLSTGPMTLPFSRMCGQLNLIGVALMGLAYLTAAFIVFRPGKGA